MAQTSALRRAHGTAHVTTRPPAPEVERPFVVERDRNLMRLRGSFKMDHAEAIWRELHAAGAKAKKGTFTIDLGAVTRIDGGVLSMLLKVRREIEERRIPVVIRGASAPVAELYDLYAEGDQPSGLPPKSRTFIEGVGALAAGGLSEIGRAVAFVGELAVETVRLVLRPRSGNWRDVGPQIERAGIDAIPIVLVINFLVGLVTALQAVTQLEAFGANIFVADIIVLGMTRELSPLITAIVVLGRSGAAYAAQIGTMTVSEELDALRVMGLSPFRYLVLPRAIALVSVVPALSLAGAFVGILGGGIIASAVLDVSTQAFASRMAAAAQLSDPIEGVIKSVAYAVAIVLIACQQGFATSGGAAGVGRRTTSTVVAALFALIVLNALFTLVFRLDVA